MKAVSTKRIIDKNGVAKRILILALTVACLVGFSASASASQLPYEGWCSSYSVGYYPYYGFAYSTGYYPYATYYGSAAYGYSPYAQPYVTYAVGAPYGYYGYRGWGGPYYAYPDWTSGWGWRYGPGWGF